MSIGLTILGVGSANPTGGFGHSASFLRFNQIPYLLDCGEGTQFRLLEHKLHIFKVEYIFITHLHGDHFLGLPGLINTFNLNGRKRPLTVVAPKGIKRYIDLHFEISCKEPDFPFEIWELEGKEAQNVLQTDSLWVRAIPLNHRIPCFGYVFEEKFAEKPLNVEECERLQIPKNMYRSIKQGRDAFLNGKTIPNNKLTLPNKKALKFSYLTDTRFEESVIPYIKDSDLLYHEATFLHELEEKANQTGHSTAREAAEIAKRANVSKLVISHYSSRYSNGKAHQSEAADIFSNTIAAYPGIEVVV